MHAATTAVALAVRAHQRAGAPSGDADTVARLKDAAARLGQEMPEILAGPSTVTPEGVLLLSLASPPAVLDAVLLVADVLRPVRTTFCAAVSRPPPGRSSSTSGTDAVVVAAEASTSSALHGIADTDIRECRVCLLMPEPEPILASLLDLILEAYDDMTHRQRQIVALAKSSDTQQQVAKHLDVSRQAVNQSLAAAGWLHIRHAEETVARRLGAAANVGGRSQRRLK